MTDFQSAFDKTTDDINNTLTTQLSSVQTWTSVSGNLIKASSSAAGFVWGFNILSQIYVCQLPCSGNWTLVDMSQQNISAVLDITTDDANVYILATNTSGKPVLLINSASNTAVWNTIPVPFNATNIFSTHSYIWAQDKSNAKQRCAKPCTMPNWSANSDVSITITSGSSSSLYGKDPSGAAMKSDETLQSGWTPIPGMAGMKINSLIGDVDQSALYAVDNQYKLNRCDGPCKDVSNVIPLETGGYAPLNLTGNPDSKQLWLTSTTMGDQGNIFSRLDKPDYSSIINIVTPLDKQRDSVVHDVQSEYAKQTDVMGINKQLEDLQSSFGEIFKTVKGHPKNLDAEATKTSLSISNTNTTLVQASESNAQFEKIIVILIAVCIVFVIGSYIIGTLVYYAVLATIGVGIYWVISGKLDISEVISFLKSHFSAF
jgi:hypothetical protein